MTSEASRQLERQIETLRQRAQAYRGNYQLLVLAGVDYNWLYRFAGGKIKNPTLKSLHRLADALDVAGPPPAM